MKKAFSLVELSIVLVILGLLTGGILAGQSLIRAAELRAVTTEYQRYFTATQSFRDKYFAMPGDFNNAQAVWGQSTACSGSSATGTCNGNGDAQLTIGAASATGEMFQFWNQLALAGLIEGNYTGVAGSVAGGYDSVVGTNVPRSKIGGSGWSAQTVGSQPTGSPRIYAGDYGNAFGFGAQKSGNTTSGAILKPEEAWNIDTKMDDGKPGSGRVMACSDNGWYNATTNPASCTLSTVATDTVAGTYNLTNTSLACSLIFTKQF